MWQIVYGCATTIVLCTWVSYHPDVPNRTYTQTRIAVIRLLSVCLSFLVPELVLLKAVDEWIEVRNYKPRVQGELCSYKNNVNFRYRLTSHTIGWTHRHTFFALMGGIYDNQKVLDLREVLRHAAVLPPRLLERVDLQADMVSEDQALSYSPESTPDHVFAAVISESEILDKSKGSSMAKLLTLAQTIWFLVQFIERWAAHQPRTQLEIMACAYALLNIFIYALWWHKPLNVTEPIDISGRSYSRIPARTTGLQDSKSLLSDALGALWHEGQFANRSGGTIIALLGILFGGVHCSAWWFHFPTRQEEILWRVCAVFCTVCPVIFLVFPSASASSGMSLAINILAMGWTMITVLPVYVVCRIILLVLTFTCLRDEPAGIFDATAWTKFLPHIG